MRVLNILRIKKRLEKTKTMAKRNYKRTFVQSVLWLLLILILYLMIYRLYIIPISKFAYSFESGLSIFGLLTVFYIGVIKVIDYAIKGVDWLLKNM